VNGGELKPICIHYYRFNKASEERHGSAISTKSHHTDISITVLALQKYDKDVPNSETKLPT
jgi:hypothetical protein